LKTISAFGCGLLASRVGIGYWSVALQISVTIHFYPPFAYVTFLAGLFQEEDFHLKDVYYSKLKDFMGNCCNRVQDWVAHIDHLMNNMRSEAWVASHVREKE
jgi:Predicted membrane protein